MHPRVAKSLGLDQDARVPRWITNGREAYQGRDRRVAARHADRRRRVQRRRHRQHRTIAHSRVVNIGHAEPKTLSMFDKIDPEFADRTAVALLDMLRGMPR